MATGLPPEKILKWRESWFYLWSNATEQVRGEQVVESGLILSQGVWAPENLAKLLAGASRGHEPRPESTAAEGLARAASIRGRLKSGRLVIKEG